MAFLENDTEHYWDECLLRLTGPIHEMRIWDYLPQININMLALGRAQDLHKPTLNSTHNEE